MVDGRAGCLGARERRAAGAPPARRRVRRHAPRARACRGARERRADERAASLLPRRAGPERRFGRRACRRGPPIDVLSPPAFARLHPTPSHPESRERLAMLLAAFVYDEVEPAPVEAVLRCHTEEHVDRIRSIEEPTWLDGDTYADETSFEAALLAAGAAIAAVERGGFALARPPGHHATAERAMGFCL